MDDPSEVSNILVLIEQLTQDAADALEQGSFEDLVHIFEKINEATEEGVEVVKISSLV